MTDVGRMSVQEPVGKVLADEYAAVLRGRGWPAQQLCCAGRRPAGLTRERRRRDPLSP